MYEQSITPAVILNTHDFPPYITICFKTLETQTIIDPDVIIERYF